MQRFIQFILVSAVLFGIGLFSQAAPYTAQTHSTLNAWFFDIGQGDAILLDTPDARQVLIDGGPSSGSITTKLIQALGPQDDELDLIILTHNHSDHLAGLLKVLERYTVKEAWISGAVHTTDGYLDFLALLKEKNVSVKAVKLGDKVQFGELSGLALTPLESMKGVTPSNQHDANITTLWQYGQTSLLITGDMETELEDRLVARNLLSPVSVLKVGHHGSETSTGERFLTALQPKIAVIQAGRNNKFSHPRASTLERLARFNIPVLRTDQDGTILFEISESGFAYKLHR